MKNALNEIQSMRDAWNTVCSAHPAQVDLTGLGYGSMNAKELLTIFDNWKDVLSVAIAKTTARQELDDKLLDLTLSKMIRDIRSRMTGDAQGNGIHWFIQNTPFLTQLGEITALISGAVEKRVSIRKELLKRVEGALNDDTLTVQKAAPIAAAVIEQAKTIQSQSENTGKQAQAATKSSEHIATIEEEMGEAKEKFDETIEEVNANAEAAKKLKDEIDAVLKEARDSVDTKSDETDTAFKEKLDAVDAVLKEAKEHLDDEKEEIETSFKAKLEELDTALQLALKQTLEQSSLTFSDINKALKEIQEQKRIADEVLKTSTKLVDDANTKLSKSIQDVTREGLAGSFNSRALEVGRERLIWQVIFSGALGGLFLVALFSEPPASIDEIGNLVKTIGLITPLVWLGWFSARQLSQVNKIVHDYRYKAAAALAFEGYKNEVAAVKNEELNTKLLETALHNFGENPVRLLADGKSDHGMPIEALLANTQDKEWFQRFLELLKALKPEIKK